MNLLLVLLLLIFVTTLELISAQHLIRTRPPSTSSTLLEFTPISPVEILTLNSSLIASNSYFTLPSTTANTSFFIYSVTFIPDWSLPQIPFTCGTPQVNCRTIRCLLTCDNTTYSLALRCRENNNQVAFGLVALSQSETWEVSDDQRQITLRVNQRMRGGSVCQFSFANNLFGRRTVGGRLRGSVVLTTRRSFPQFSGIPFHPSRSDFSLWNNTRTSLDVRATADASLFPSAYVRCATTGVVTFVQDPSSTDVTSSLSNWTEACCYDAVKNTGNCSIAYSNSSTPTFYFRNRTALFSSTSLWSENLDSASSLIVWTRPNNKINDISLLDCSPSSGTPLTINISILVNASIDNHYQVKNSLFSVLKMIPDNHPNKDSNAVGVFRCYDDAGMRNNTSSSMQVLYYCLAFASNKSFALFLDQSELSSSFSSPSMIPICQSSQSRNGESISPLGPLDDASSFTSLVTPTLASTQELQTLSTPQGSCYNYKNSVECKTPCQWSLTWSVCLWGDSFNQEQTSSSSSSSNSTSSGTTTTLPFTTAFGGGGSSPSSSSSSSAVIAASQLQARSVDCQWSVEGRIRNNVEQDGTCTLHSSDRSFSSLLSALCFQKGVVSNRITSCVNSAFSCSSTYGSIESNVDVLMAYYCLPTIYNGATASSCTDSLLTCSPNATSIINLNPFLTTSADDPNNNGGGGTTADPLFILTVVSNRTEILVNSEIRTTGNNNNDLLSYVPVGIFLVATGAYFNLTAIRLDLAARTRDGFDLRVPGDSSNFGRFSLQEKFNDLFPDPDFAITDIYGSGANVSLADSLVIRIAKTNSFHPLPGTYQYLDINPQQHSPGNPWMSPGTQFTFQSVTISFYEEPMTSCSYLGIAVATVVFGLLSGLSGWLIVGAVQMTLVAGQSSCAPDLVRQCTSPTRALVNIAHAFWTDEDNNSGFVPNYDRKVFWTEFGILMFVLAFHSILIRVYKYFAPLRGSPERTLWYPAPGYLLSGIFAVGTVQKAWVVIFSDENTALRVLSFFCFIAIIAAILPWWFLQIFREKENYYKGYDFTKFYKQIVRNTTSVEEANDRERKLLEEYEARERRQGQHNNSSSPKRKTSRKNSSKHHHRDSSRKKDDKTSNAPASSSVLLAAESTNLSLRHTEHMDKRRAKSRHTWASKSEEIGFHIFSFFLPSGWWPHTRGMSPARDLLHSKGCYFSWVSLVILGICGLNFSYVGVDVDLCSANYVNHAVLQAMSVVFTLYWRPFRIPVLNLLWVIARLLDFSFGIVAADWISLGVPSEDDKSQTLSNLAVGSLVFMLIFSIFTFILKFKEGINLLANETDHLVGVQQEERALDMALTEIAAENNNNNEQGDGKGNEGKRSGSANSEKNNNKNNNSSANFHDRFGSLFMNDDDENSFTLTNNFAPVAPISAVASVGDVNTTELETLHHDLNCHHHLNNYSPTVSNRSRRAIDPETNPLTYKRDTQYDFNYYHGQDDFDTSPRIERAEEELLFGSGNGQRLRRKQQQDHSSSFHRLEIWWDHDGKLNDENNDMANNSDFDNDDDNSGDDHDHNKNTKSLSSPDDFYYDVDLVQSRSQRTANLLAAFGSVLKIHEIPPDRRLPASKNEFDYETSSSSSEFSSSSSSSCEDEENPDFEDEEEKEQKQARRLEKEERRRERQIRFDLKQQHKKIERKKNRLRRKGYRLIVTFGDSRDAIVAARSLAGKVDEGSKTRIFCELLPDHFDFSPKKIQKPKYYQQQRQNTRTSSTVNTTTGFLQNRRRQQQRQQQQHQNRSRGGGGGSMIGRDEMEFL